MRSVEICAAVLIASCVCVIAGPEPIQTDSKAVVTAPVQHELCNWTGFYVGANAGGAFAGHADVSLDLTGLWERFVEPSDESFAEPLGSKDLDASALVAGGFLGYNYQWNHFVVGGEADFDFVGLRNSFDSGLQFVNPGTGDAIVVRQSFKSHYLITVGPRFGYSWDKFLFYATGGLAIGDLDFRQIIKEPEEGFRQEGSTDDTQVGWTAGGGVEFCLTEHWRARLEYRYTDLGCVDFSSVGSDSVFTGRHEACLTYHAATAGLAYKF
jgi:outer membrane immunogenic protein